MSEPIWLGEASLRAIHDLQLAEHGGAPGIRDHETLRRVLAHPQQLARDSERTPDLATLAASYGAGIARDRPFVDGNSRTALVAVETFLKLNGSKLQTSNTEWVEGVNALASGVLTEVLLASRLRQRLRPAA